MYMHRWHGLWIITQGLCMSLSFAIVLVHTVSTSIQCYICFYRQNWIIIQLLSTNEQSSYPNGPSLSGYIILLFVVHTWQYAYECFRILHLQLHTVTIYAYFFCTVYTSVISLALGTKWTFHMEPQRAPLLISYTFCSNH